MFYLPEKNLDPSLFIHAQSHWDPRPPASRQSQYVPPHSSSCSRTSFMVTGEAFALCPLTKGKNLAILFREIKCLNHVFSTQLCAKYYLNKLMIQ